MAEEGGAGGRDRRVMEAARAAGLVGQGGAGFPTHVKLSSQVEVVIANGAECEPLLGTDKAAMVHQPQRVIEGLQLAMAATGAQRGVVATKAHYREVIRSLSPYIQDQPSLSLKLLDDFYPSGDEHVLVHEVLGRVIPEGGLPLHVGALVQNVGTLSDLTRAVEGHPVVDKMVTVTGEVVSPRVVWAPVGTPFRDLIQRAGGLKAADWAILHGGPMMGKVIRDLDHPVDKTTSGLIVLERDHPYLQRRTLPLKEMIRRSLAACCQCRACTDLCTRHLLGHDLEPHKVMRALNYSLDQPEHLTQAYLCCLCGLCEVYACVMELSPRDIFERVRGELAARGVRSPHQRRPEEAREAQAFTRVPKRRLLIRLGMVEYDRPLALDQGPVVPAWVRLPLKQHTGAPALALVRRGDRVTRGQVIGEIPEGALGARVHASIDGRVRAVDERGVTIDGLQE